jgi:hypothetical protein
MADSLHTGLEFADAINEQKWRTMRQHINGKRE